MRDAKQSNLILILGITLLGVMLRVLIMEQSGWRIDYDEAMMGLLALDIQNGAFPVFIPAQPTLGAQEAYLLAGTFTLFGVSTMSFRIVSLAFGAGFIGSTGILGTLAFGRRAGTLAALFTAIAPPYLLVNGMKTWGGTTGTLVLGNVLFILTVIALQWRRVIWFVLLGLTAGLMFWLAWLAFYYFIPVALVFGWALLYSRDRILLKGLLAASIGFGFGSLPFWVYNLTHGGETFVAMLGSPPVTPEERLGILAHLFSDSLPRLVSGSPEWGGIGQDTRFILVIFVLISLVWLLGITWQRCRKPGAALRFMLAVLALTVPGIYLNSVHARNALPAFNPFNVDATGRYLLMWYSAILVALSGFAIWLARYTRLAGIGFAAVALAFNLIGLANADPVRLFDSPYYDRLPRDLSPLIAFLHEHHIRYVWTDIGIAQPLTFITQREILAADYWDAKIAGGLMRFPRTFDAVYNAALSGERVAYVEPVATNQSFPPILLAMDKAAIAYTAYWIDNLLVVIPDAALDPAEVAAGLGYQY